MKKSQKKKMQTIPELGYMSRHIFLGVGQTPTGWIRVCEGYLREWLASITVLVSFGCCRNKLPPDRVT